MASGDASVVMFDGVAIVTGAASGIGAATAARLSALGAIVVGVDLEEVAPPLTAVAGEATDEATCRRAVETATGLGQLRWLVNSVGLQVYGNVVDTDPEVWERVLAVNLTSYYLMSRAAIPVIRREQGGAIVHVSSVQALATQRDVAAYAAAKGGALSLTRAMALDHAGEGIRVNCVLPGAVDTPLVRANAAAENPARPEEQLAEWGRKHALGRLAEPEEIASSITHLLSDEASFVTGSAFVVDGGLSASF